MNKRLISGIALAIALGAAGPLTAQQDPPSTGRDPSCRECGVITSVRELQQERAAASTVTERLPPVGPVFGFTFGGDAPVKGFVGAVGNQEMRDRLTEISYEVTVRYNDGRYGMVETRYGADLRVGDPVKVDRNKIELDL
jgi:outer membrane lipoprotein SlyB